MGRHVFPELVVGLVVEVLSLPFLIELGEADVFLVLVFLRVEVRLDG